MPNHIILRCALSFVMVVVAGATWEDFERLAHSTVLGPVDDCPVWSIVCFVVGRRERGHGIARALLDAAIDYARANGATMLEAYPADTGGDRIPSAYAYKGTLAMFERAGFRVVARRQSNPTTPVRPIVRLELRASSSRANSPGPGVDIVMRWRRSVPAEFRRYITEQRRRQHRSWQSVGMRYSEWGFVCVAKAGRS